MCKFKDTNLGIKKLDFNVKRGAMAAYLTDGRKWLGFDEDGARAPEAFGAFLSRLQPQAGCTVFVPLLAPPEGRGGSDALYACLCFTHRTNN